VDICIDFHRPELGAVTLEYELRTPNASDHILNGKRRASTPHYCIGMFPWSSEESRQKLLRASDEGDAATVRALLKEATAGLQQACSEVQY
jgi:hypothetical protein